MAKNTAQNSSHVMLVPSRKLQQYFTTDSLSSWKLLKYDEIGQKS